jgi:hypothetical protein
VVAVYSACFDDWGVHRLGEKPFEWYGKKNVWIGSCASNWLTVDFGEQVDCDRYDLHAQMGCDSAGNLAYQRRE